MFLYPSLQSPAAATRHAPDGRNDATLVIDKSAIPEQRGFIGRMQKLRDAIHALDDDVFHPNFEVTRSGPADAVEQAARFLWHPSAVRPAPMRPASIISFAVAFVAVSVVADKSAMFVGLSLVSRDTPRSVTGTITDWRAGKSIAVRSDSYEPGLAMTLRPKTVYERDGNTIKVGDRVTVWYRNLSERRPVVEKVRVLDR